MTPGERWLATLWPLVGARLDEGAFVEAWEQGRALTIDEAVALALDSLE